MILAGDVGGTKVLLALVDPAAAGHGIVAEARFRSDEFESFEAIVERFLTGRGVTIRSACFGIAGPVVEGRVRMTNLPWTPDRKSLARLLGTENVRLLNDLEATAYGIETLGDQGFEILAAGQPRGETTALFAAGTGVNGATLTRIDGRPHVLPAEFGHVGFAPRDSLEDDLLRWLRSQGEPVGIENVVSGPGLHAIYRFLRDSGREREPAWLAQRLEAADEPQAAISAAALAGEAAICEAALNRLVLAYGRAAGDFVLASLALKGLVVGGGIAPAILPALRTGDFSEAVRAKGPMRDLLGNLPIRVILEPRAALLGALRRAKLA